jgi:hypothetical protein
MTLTKKKFSSRLASKNNKSEKKMTEVMKVEEQEEGREIIEIREAKSFDETGFIDLSGGKMHSFICK